MMLLFSAERTEDWREEGLESQSHIARGMAGKIKNESMDALVGGTLNSLKMYMKCAYSLMYNFGEKMIISMKFTKASMTPRS